MHYITDNVLDYFIHGIWRVGMEIKPCPFCGGVARIREKYFINCDTEYKIQCKECFCTTRGHWEVDEAITAWNQRIDSGNEGMRNGGS